MNNRPIHFVLLFFLVISISGCLFSPHTNETITGLWIENQKTCINENELDCGSFEFYSDGRFVAQNIPMKYFIIGSNPGRLDATGSWELNVSTKSNRIGELNKVDLIFNPVSGFPIGFISEIYISVDNLALFQGQEGDEIIFNKK
jgi:hypothetical protein